MLNILLLITSTGFVVCFAWFCAKQGKEALITWIALLTILANFFVLKQIQVLGLNATASDVFAIGGILGLNLLQEQYGEKAAKKAIWITFICMTFFCIMSQIHLLYLPNSFDKTQYAYTKLLAPSPRILIASLSVYFIVQHVTIGLYRMLRKMLPQSSLVFITVTCLFISQLLDTLLFTFLGLYGLVSALFEVILVSYTIKIIVILVSIPFSKLSQFLGLNPFSATNTIQNPLIP
jgi:uncharacterized integral membrane protein (TIGR00697 family)